MESNERESLQVDTAFAREITGFNFMFAPGWWLLSGSDIASASMRSDL